MVDRQRLDQLLALLARYVAILRQLSVTPLDDFASDPRNHGSAERCNLLVHHYADVPPQRVHEILSTRLGDFDRFAEQITSYADRS